jgi:hypothetical protein
MLKADSGGSYIQLIETFANLGPITDMILIDTDAQTHLITTSGAYKVNSSIILF